MPELPEVETVVRDLNKKVVGFEIADFWTEWEKSIKMPLKKFKSNIIGKKIKEVKRRGKNILVFLEGGWVMLVHLKMTGHLLFKDKENKYFKERVNQYIRHIWHLRKGKKEISLEFSDLRKFGKIELIKENKIAEEKSLASLGIEPLEKDFDAKYLWQLTRKNPKKNIKMLIMEQALIVGVGNIYASEALFEAGIKPLRKAGGLTKKEVAKLYEVIIKILKKAIKLRGTSDSDYRDTSGAPGGYQKVLKVYNREGEKCYCCDNKIERVKIGQRSTFWCRKCQK